MSAMPGLASPPWPGFAMRGGALLLPLPRTSFADVATGCTVDGIAFRPKTEFHLTLLGRGPAAAVRAALGEDDAPLRAAFAAQDWRLRRTGERWLLRDADADGAHARHSIIECLDAPALAAFRARVARLAGFALPSLPAHATLYTAGDHAGIGLPSDAVFAQRRVRRRA